MATPTPTPTGPESQNVRRLKFGLNVTVAAAIAIAIVVLVNAMAYRHFQRFDFTATRAYSLAPQSEKVLDQLEADYRFVTILPEGNRYSELTRDLLDEYARQSERIAVEHLRPTSLRRIDEVKQTVRARFDDELEPVTEAIDAGMQALRLLEDNLADMERQTSEILAEIQRHDGDWTGRLEDNFNQLRNAAQRYRQQIPSGRETFAEALDEPLPLYDAVLMRLRQLVVEELYQAILGSTLVYSQSVLQEQLPDSVLNEALDLANRVTAWRQAVEPMISQLTAVGPIEDYTALSRQLDDRAPRALVLLLSQEDVRTISLEELFTEPDLQLTRDRGAPDRRYIGETIITGALASLSLPVTPMVVFIETGRQPAIGPRGGYQMLERELNKLNFDVRSWNPAGGQANRAGGQRAAPEEAPQPEPGQPAVWIALPNPGDGNPMSMLTATGQRQAVRALLDERMAAGDGVLAFLSFSPTSQFGGGDPIADLARDFGVIPQDERVVLERIVGDNQRERINSNIEVDNWSDAHPITRPVQGVGLVAEAIPLSLHGDANADADGRDGDADGDDAQSTGATALASIEGERFWAETDLMGEDPIAYDEATAGGPFVIAAAAQRGERRLVVVGDPVFASDRVAAIGVADAATGALIQSAYPANLETTVNSVLWLAGLEELIAASPRTQDVPRIQEVERSTRLAIQWGLLAGMPLLIAGAGLGVWILRSRG